VKMPLRRALLLDPGICCSTSPSTGSTSYAALFAFDLETTLGGGLVGAVMLARVQGPANEGAQDAVPVIASVVAMMAALAIGRCESVLTSVPSADGHSGRSSHHALNDRHWLAGGRLFLVPLLWYARRKRAASKVCKSRSGSSVGTKPITDNR
jgi:hypothetical protein